MSSSKKPWELVTDPRYFQGVLKSFVALGFGPKRDGEASVRFGNTGGGHSPNYQIQTNEGNIYCYGGRTHERRAEGEFDSENLSEEKFSYTDVTTMLARARRR